VQVVASAGAVLAAFAAANDEQRDVAIIDADNPAIYVLALGSALAAHAPFATARRILIASNDEVTPDRGGGSVLAPIWFDRCDNLNSSIAS
jgi:hypothetical protein